MEKTVDRTGVGKGTIFGEYVRLRCGNCGKWNGTWTHNQFFAVDCDCTLWATGSRYRTTNESTPSTV